MLSWSPSLTRATIFTLSGPMHGERCYRNSCPRLPASRTDPLPRSVRVGRADGSRPGCSSCASSPGTWAGRSVARFVDARPGVALPPRLEPGSRLLAGDVAPDWVESEGRVVRDPFEKWGSLIFSSRLAIKPFALPDNSSPRALPDYLAFAEVPLPAGTQAIAASIHPPTPIRGRCPRRPRPGEAQRLRRGTRTCSRGRSSSVTSSRSTARMRRSAIASSLSSSSRPLGSSKTARSLRPMIAEGTGLSCANPVLTASTSSPESDRYRTA
jgi:hypothetical protein